MLVALALGLGEQRCEDALELDCALADVRDAGDRRVRRLAVLDVEQRDALAHREDVVLERIERRERGLGLTDVDPVQVALPVDERRIGLCEQHVHSAAGGVVEARQPLLEVVVHVEPDAPLGRRLAVAVEVRGLRRPAGDARRAVGQDQRDPNVGDAQRLGLVEQLLHRAVARGDMAAGGGESVGVEQSAQLLQGDPGRIRVARELDLLEADLGDLWQHLRKSALLDDTRQRIQLQADPLGRQQPTVGRGRLGDRIGRLHIDSRRCGQSGASPDQGTARHPPALHSAHIRMTLFACQTRGQRLCPLTGQSACD